jgi:hypothetical protein
MKLRCVPFSVGLLLVGNTRTAVASLIDALYEACGFLLVLHRGAADFIERRLHAIPLQIRHRGQNLGTLQVFEFRTKTPKSGGPERNGLRRAISGRLRAWPVNRSAPKTPENLPFSATSGQEESMAPI